MPAIQTALTPWQIAKHWASLDFGVKDKEIHGWRDRILIDTPFMATTSILFYEQFKCYCGSRLRWEAQAQHNQNAVGHHSHVSTKQGIDANGVRLDRAKP